MKATLQATKPSRKEARRKVPGLRWWLLALVFGAAVLNYVDRQTLSALAPTVQQDLGMSDRDYANVVNIFLLAYTVSYLFAGRIADRIGTRASMGLFVGWWSVSDMLTAAAQGIRSLGTFRFSLGLGEAGVWPVASKVVSEWFPARERALAIGIYTMGATIGASMAPYIVIPLATFPYGEKLPLVGNLLGHGAGWRLAFILTGAAGLVWLIPWLWLYCKPRESKLVTEGELEMIEGGPAGGSTEETGAGWTWGRVLTFKATWLLLLARLMTDPVWYFFQFWFSKYLNTERGLSQSQLKITWIVYAAAGVGSLAGGWLSGSLVKRGIAPAASRLWVMSGCACLLTLSPLIARVSDVNAAMGITAIMVFGSLAWLTNISSLVIDVVPRHSLGTVFGVVAAGSTLGGILMNMCVASMLAPVPTKPGGFLDQAVGMAIGPVLEAVQGRGYGLWFLAMAFLYPLAFLILWIGKVHRPKEIN